MADRRRCLVVASVVTATGGYQLGPGQIVDLDLPIGGGRKLRDDVDPAWFAPVDPDPVPVPRRRPRGAHSESEE